VENYFRTQLAFELDTRRRDSFRCIMFWHNDLLVAIGVHHLIRIFGSEGTELYRGTHIQFIGVELNSWGLRIDSGAKLSDYVCLALMSDARSQTWGEAVEADVAADNDRACSLMERIGLNRTVDRMRTPGPPGPLEAKYITYFRAR